MATKKTKPAWERPAPKRKRAAKRGLSSTQKAAAKRRAKKAGRPYPNLVDNMQEAAKTSKKRRRAAKRQR